MSKSSRNQALETTINQTLFDRREVIDNSIVIFEMELKDNPENKVAVLNLEKAKTDLVIFVRAVNYLSDSFALRESILDLCNSLKNNA